MNSLKLYINKYISEKLLLPDKLLHRINSEYENTNNTYYFTFLSLLLYKLYNYDYINIYSIIITDIKIDIIFYYNFTKNILTFDSYHNTKIIDCIILEHIYDDDNESIIMMIYNKNPIIFYNNIIKTLNLIE